MPDVTPKTESGRALLAKKHRAIPTSESGERHRDETLAAVLAIENEAASKAVAEVRIAVEKMRELVPKIDAPHAHVRIATLDAVLALIASERKP